MFKFLIFIFMCFLCIYTYNSFDIDLFSFVFAEDEENYENVKTDLEDLKYDFKEEDIKEFVTQYDRMSQIEEDKLKLEDEYIEIEKNISLMDQRLDDLKYIKNRIDRKFKDNILIDEKSLDKLVKAYSLMKPQEAGGLLIKHDLGIIVKIFDRIKESVMGKILSQMIIIDPKRSVRIVELYTGFNTTFTKELLKKEFDNELNDSNYEKENEES